jgi:arginine-tRNA-protein transferase
MFEEWECAVYLDNRLVAISFVDIGRNSMASIMCCFAKDQEKSSLGIYTMLLEMEFAKNRGLTYYYPGYVMDFSDAFAYKLSLGAAEWLNSKGQWTLNREEVLDHTYMKLLNQKMNALHEMLALHGIDATLKYYPFFAMGYLPTPEKLLELPSFFSWRQGERNFGAGYHVDEGRYLFFELSYAQELQDLQPPKFTEEFLNNPIYELDYIKTDIRVYFDTFSALYALIEEVLANKSVDRLTKR